MVLPFFPPLRLFWNRGSGRDEEPSGENPPPDSDPFSDAEFEKILSGCQNNSRPAGNHRIQFDKRSQLFIRSHNEPLSVAAMRVSNPDCWSLASTVGTQPKLQPRLLRLSAIISQSRSRGTYSVLFLSSYVLPMKKVKSGQRELNPLLKFRDVA